MKEETALKFACSALQFLRNLGEPRSGYPKIAPDLEKTIPAFTVKGSETDTGAVLSCTAQTWVLYYEYFGTLFFLVVKCKLTTYFTQASKN